jgi:hypothetical protein
MIVSKYFTPADYSDVESEILKVEVPTREPQEVENIPLVDRVRIRDSIVHEFDACENGTSKISRRPAVQFKAASPARNVLTNVVTKPTVKDLNMLIFTTKEDYGYLVATWVCEKISPIYPKATLILEEIMKGRLDVTSK